MSSFLSGRCRGLCILSLFHTAMKHRMGWRIICWCNPSVMDIRNRFDIRFRLEKKMFSKLIPVLSSDTDVFQIRTLFTSSSSVSDVTWWTSTISAVVVHRTLGWFDARIISGARIDTFGVYACLVAWTIRVWPTASYHAGYLRISGHSGWTFAHGLMVDAVTFRCRSATAAVRGAHGYANTVDACVLTRAVGFTSTTGWKHVNDFYYP